MPGVAGPATNPGMVSRGGGGGAGRTEFVLDDVDLEALREVRGAAAGRIAEMRVELEAAEAELAVVDDALAQAAGLEEAEPHGA
jgi:hypothetical protein